MHQIYSREWSVVRLVRIGKVHGNLCRHVVTTFSSVVSHCYVRGGTAQRSRLAAGQLRRSFIPPRQASSVLWKPAGFYEIVDGSHVQGTLVQHLSNTLDGGGAIFVRQDARWRLYRWRPIATQGCEERGMRRFDSAVNSQHH